jgi:hypothetical protein
MAPRNVFFSVSLKDMQLEAGPARASWLCLNVNFSNQSVGVK